MLTTTKILLAAALTAGSIANGASAATPFNATSDPSVFSEKVSIAGLDIQTQAGAEIALHRIRAAAHDVCDLESDPRLPGVYVRVKACTTAAIDRAVADVHSPMLSALSIHSRSGAQLASEGQ